MRWLDYKAFKRDFDAEEEKSSDVSIFDGVMGFVFFGGRHTYKRLFDDKFWWFLIPGVNLVPLLFVVIATTTFPIRLIILGIQRIGMSKIYDIEATENEYKIVRNREGLMGVCHWDISYTMHRYITISMKYKNVYRSGNYLFIRTLDGYIGLATSGAEWIVPISDKCTSISQYNESVFFGRSANGKTGMYLCDANNCKCVVPCIYHKMEVMGDLVVATLNNKQYYFNLQGDRVIL